MNQKINVILDCDTGIDDALAILMAVKSDVVDLKGISVCAGNTTLQNAYLNTKRMLKFLNREDIPVICGASKPLKKDPVIADETHGVDGFGEISSEFDRKFGFDTEKEIELFEKKKDTDSICDFFKEVAEKEENTVIVSIGPMTNIALCLEKCPEIFSSVDRIVSMGGTYKSHGNTSPVAEFNYWFDSDAANYVYSHSPVKIEMIGLDVTRKIVLDYERLEKVKSLSENTGRFIEKLTKFYFDFHREYENIEGCVINDPLTFAYLIDEKILKGFSSFTEIACDGIARGQSIVDKYDFYGHEHNSVIFTEVDEERFFDIFYDLIEEK